MKNRGLNKMREDVATKKSMNKPYQYFLIKERRQLCIM